MFKSLLIAIVVVVGMYMTVEIFYNQDVVVEKEVTTEVETIDVLNEKITKAKLDAQASTTAKAEEAYKQVVAEEEARIENEVKLQYIKEIEDSLSPE
jgi:Tfp pilus assembly major pilin PilA